MKKSLFSLFAGCIAALAVNSFTAHPLLSTVVQGVMAAAG